MVYTVSISTRVRVYLEDEKLLRCTADLIRSRFEEEEEEENSLVGQEYKPTFSVAQ